MKDQKTIKMLQELGAFILAGANGKKDVAQMMRMISDARGWRWAGVYKLVRNDLVIVAGSHDEPVCYPKFPATQGLCGASVESRQTIVVNDVSKDKRYLPTFHSTRSEIVVPIISRSDKVVGVITAESEKLKAFGKDDREVLEKVAMMMGQAFK